jgi:hypothetical protein
VLVGFGVGFRLDLVPSGKDSFFAPLQLDREQPLASSAPAQDEVRYQWGRGRPRMVYPLKLLVEMRHTECRVRDVFELRMEPTDLIV